MSVISYKVRARGKWDWRLFDTVRMEISVGQPYHEGEKLKAAMNWARSNFPNQYIILGDTTQRYNIMFEEGLSETDARAKALQLGTEWLERNQEYLHYIKITRWDDWIAHPAYEETYRRIVDYYRKNQEFRSALMGATHEFWERQDIPEEKKELFFKNSERYLLEETSVFAVAYNELGGISAYPGGFLELWEMFVESENNEIPEGLKKGYWARLQFNRQKPQVA